MSQGNKAAAVALTAVHYCSSDYALWTDPQRLEGLRRISSISAEEVLSRAALEHCYGQDLSPGTSVQIPPSQTCTVRQSFELFHVVESKGSLSYLPREADFLIS